MKTLVYVDHFKGEIQPASWEALGLAKSLGTAGAVIFGSGVDAIAQAAFEHGADEVLLRARFVSKPGPGPVPNHSADP
jgi:electron transfer flavoprotein alpha subunit